MTDEDTCVFLCIHTSSVHIQDTSDIEHPEEGKKNWKKHNTNINSIWRKFQPKLSCNVSTPRTVTLKWDATSWFCNKHLGITLTNHNSKYEEIASTLNSRHVCYHSLQNLLSPYVLSTSRKINIRSGIILHVVLNGSCNSRMSICEITGLLR
jgi:hypothetical protein